MSGRTEWAIQALCSSIEEANIKTRFLRAPAPFPWISQHLVRESFLGYLSNIRVLPVLAGLPAPDASVGVGRGRQRDRHRERERPTEREIFKWPF